MSAQKIHSYITRYPVLMTAQKIHSYITRYPVLMSAQKIHSYITRYPVLASAQSAFHTRNTPLLRHASVNVFLTDTVGSHREWQTDRCSLLVLIKRLGR